MRIVLASSFVPHVNGGARFIVEWTEEMLRAHGHEVERFYLPFVDEPDDVLGQMAAYRLMDLSQSCDRLIAFRPPSHVLQHPNKVLWFIHHIRVFYDLWDQGYGTGPQHPRQAASRRRLMSFDTAALREARRVFTNSRVVSERMERFNGVASEPLYPPLWRPERFIHEDYGDEIVLVSRVEPHKRQMLAIEAMAHVRTPVRLRLCGKASSAAYAAEVRSRLRELGVEDRVIFEDAWISEDDKADRLANALAVAYLPIDEDSYGYPSLEAAHARKAVLTTTDSGGVLELVDDRRNGLVLPPEPVALAAAFDELWQDRRLARRLGEANGERVRELRIDWDRVVEALTG
ncbi:glycosyltransferase family 4 protein [Phenylobacterium sp.]|jgi:glycosyltransferase involved in cell wall biosynthesis|uniref:glycosyltransferase family 4 protein n=1 Tax=Phenylobacterium sp. TaxID=1871053 RepID=UPI002F93D0B5